MDWTTVIVSLVAAGIVGPGGSAFFKFLSDQSIERQKSRQGRELLETQNALSVGTTSHMATVVFDKHIGFCEEYVEEMYRALHILIQDGRAQESLDTERFSQIRQKWALWLTHKIENELDRFELTIAQIIGGSAPDVDANGAPVSNERSITRSIAYLRGVLLTEELTALRRELVIGTSRKPLHI